MAFVIEWTHGLFTSLDITIRKDDNFTLNCGPTIPVGCKEQIANAGPFLSYEGAGTQTTCPNLLGSLVEEGKRAWYTLSSQVTTSIHVVCACV